METQSYLNMDMADLHKIQTDPGTKLSDRQDTLLTKTHQQEKLQNVASKDTTLRSTQAFSTLPYTHGENENMEIWKYFFGKKLEIFL